LFSIAERLSTFHDSDVRRPVLGRGLKSLLKGRRTNGAPGDAVPHPERLDQLDLNSGLGTLWRGARASAPEAEAEKQRPIPTFNPLRQNWTAVKWLLLAADLLLLILASLLVLKSPGRLSLPEWILCFVTLTIGAVLALLAWLGNPAEP